MKLKDKVVIVTGSARALGRAFAIRYAQEGARVVACDITDTADTVSAIESEGGEALSLITDVTSEQSTVEMAEKTVQRFGRIDVLVNNAGMYADIIKKPFYQIPGDEWDKIMAVNVKGPFLCSQAVFPAMKEQGNGKIINIASAAAFVGGSQFAHYVASKGGVVSLTRALAQELGPHNININAVAPGLTVTEYNVKTTPKEVLEMAMAKRCLKRQQQPEDLLGVMMFLASDESNFITGQTIVVNGGAYFH